MIEILIVEDDISKAEVVSSVLKESTSFERINISFVHTIVSAKLKLEHTSFDVMIVDLFMPLREGEDVNPDNSIALLKELESSPFLKMPTFIVGLTKFSEIAKDFEHYFEERLFYLLNYDVSSNEWKSKLKKIIYHLYKSQEEFFSPKDIKYKYDAAIIAALYDPEFIEVKKISKEWTKIKFDGDPTSYYETSVGEGSRRKKILASFCDQMGMVSTSTLATKIMLKFRPKYLIMAGISAGLKRKGVNYGDILVADVCWDYNSGKISQFEFKSAMGDIKISKTKFEPEPKSIPLYPSLKVKLMEFCTNKEMLAEIKSNYDGVKVKSILNAHIGPLASGSQVVASNKRLNEIKDQNRKLIGIEMEAYGLFYACNQFSDERIIPVVFKSVCDFGNSKKNDKYQKYAAYTSAQFTLKFILDCIE